MILFFGPPGSGKSIQGELLVKKHGWKWLSTGRLFRDSKDAEVLSRLSTGELIDDELTNKVVDQALAEVSKDGEMAGIVMDGYPRNIPQAEWLERQLPEHGRELQLVIIFEVPESELLKRLSGRGRAEDVQDVIKKRLAIYHENTKPVVDFYQKRGVPLAYIDGQGSIEDVHQRIQEALSACSLV